MMKIATVAVNGGRRFRQAALDARSQRIDLLIELVKHLSSPKDGGISLLLLPAGFLACTRTNQVPGLARIVAERLDASRPGFDVVWGIDAWVGTGKQRRLRRDAVGYPFFACCRSRSGDLVVVQQVSVTADEGRSRDILTRWGTRSALLPGSHVALLICGESWSDTLFDSVEAAQARALVIPAHQNVNLLEAASGWGQMSWHRRLAAFAVRSRIPVVLAEHTRSPGRHMYCWGCDKSTRLDLPEGLRSLFTVNVAVLPAAAATAPVRKSRTRA